MPTNTNIQTHTGIIKWWNPTKGYGIVSLVDRIDDIVFQAETQSDFQEGNQVSIAVQANPAGLKVVQIQKIEKSE